MLIKGAPGQQQQLYWLFEIGRISQEMLKILILDMPLKISNPRCLLYLPGAIELKSKETIFFYNNSAYKGIAYKACEHKLPASG